jgi:hypothetical protein
MEGKRERILIVMAMLKVSQADVAKATGYTNAQVSKTMNVQEPTGKFVLAFCKAFPKANKEYILNNTGEPLIGVDLSIYGFKNESADKQEIGFLRQQLSEMKAQITFLQSMLEKAMSIHPDLVGKLNLSVAKHGKKEQKSVFNLFTQSGGFQGGYVQN